MMKIINIFFILSILLFIGLQFNVAVAQNEVEALLFDESISGETQPGGFKYYSISTYQRGGGTENRVLYIQLLLERQLPLDDGNSVYLIASRTPSPQLEDAEFSTSFWDNYRFYEEGDEFYPIDWSQILLGIEAPHEGVWYIGIYCVSTGSGGTVPFSLTAYYPELHVVEPNTIKQASIPEKSFSLFVVESDSDFLLTEMGVDGDAADQATAYLSHGAYPTIQVHDISAEINAPFEDVSRRLETIGRSRGAGNKWIHLINNVEGFVPTAVNFRSTELQIRGSGGSDDDDDDGNQTTITVLAIFVTILGVISLVSVGIILGHLAKGKFGSVREYYPPRKPTIGSYKMMNNENKNSDEL